MWTGTLGTLITKPINSSTNAHHWTDFPSGPNTPWLNSDVCWPICWSARILNVCCRACGASSTPGTLARHAAASATLSTTCAWASCWSVSARRSLLKYSIRIAINISTLPTSVYKKNLIAAYSRRGPPHTPIRKYIGSSMTSQKT